MSVNSSPYVRCGKSFCLVCLYRFSLNLRDDAAITTPLHADIRMGYYGYTSNRFVLDTLVNRSWLHNHIVLDMPSAFKEGQPFEMEFRLLSTTEVQVKARSLRLQCYPDI